MHTDPWDDVRKAFLDFTERLEAAPELIATGLKSFTWDLFTRGKMPTQALQDIKDKAKELDARVKAHRDRYT